MRKLAELLCELNFDIKFRKTKQIIT